MTEEKRTQGRTLKELYEDVIRRYEKEEKRRSEELCRLKEDLDAAKDVGEAESREKQRHLENMYNEAKGALEDVKRNIALYSDKIDKLKGEQC